MLYLNKQPYDSYKNEPSNFKNSGPEIVILEVYDQDLTNNFFKDNEYIQENDYYYNNNNKQRNQSYDNNMLPDPYERYTQKLTPDDYYLESLNNRQNNMNQNKRNDYLSKPLNFLFLFLLIANFDDKEINSIFKIKFQKR